MDKISSLIFVMLFIVGLVISAAIVGFLLKLLFQYKSKKNELLDIYMIRTREGQDFFVLSDSVDNVRESFKWSEPKLSHDDIKIVKVTKYYGNGQVINIGESLQRYDSYEA